MVLERLTHSRAPVVLPLVALLAAQLTLTSCGDALGVEDASTPGAIAVSANRLRAHVAALADDSLCGRKAGTRYEAKAAAYVSARFAEIGLEPGGTDGYFQPFSLGPLPRGTPPATDRCASDPVLTSENVIGVLRGAGALAADWVVLGAHYDHVGWEVVDGLTTVYNGADDNASGTAVVLEAARLFRAWIAAHPEAAANRRSILFQTFGGEELGLFGSRHFTALPTVPGDAIYAMVNLDMVGRLRDATLIVGGTGTSSGWLPLLSAAQPNGVGYSYEDVGLDRSDQWFFILTLDVPALHLFTGLHEDYHAPTDDVERVRFGGMQQVTQLVLGLLWELTTRPGSL